ncbi:MAG: ABC transporter ATP-binding protein [Thermoprotei archaeon]|nr:MAG: ABC transporter ATP-binding protein [Thermoprotei archaeon]
MGEEIDRKGIRRDNAVNRSLTRMLLGYMSKHRAIILATLAIAITLSALSVISPLLIGRSIDLLVVRDISELWKYVILLISIAIAQSILSFLQRYLSTYLSQNVVYDIRNQLYSHLYRLSYGFFNKMPTGQVISRMTSDVDTIGVLIRFTLIHGVYAITTVILALVIMSMRNITLTMLVLCILPIISLIVIPYSRRVRKYFSRTRELYGEMTSLLQESIAGIKIVRTLPADVIFADRFSLLNRNYLSTMVRITRLRALTRSVLAFIVSFTLLIVYWYGGLKTIAGELTIGDIVSFSLYTNMLMWPLITLGFLVALYERAKISMKRLTDILGTRSEVLEASDASDIKIRYGSINFENVWFSYDDKSWVLKGINLNIEPGEIVAIVGPTGSGKTSLLHLLLRLYDPQKGRICIDGIDIKKFKLESLRRQIGIVHQDIFLFPSSIKDNIAYGKPTASLEEIMKVAKMARIHDFISSLPLGYDTPVGERGVTLSGGQRQRLAIARALLLDPKIILMDDPISQIDSETEMAIYNALTKYFKGKTVLITTQRLSTLRLADRVVIMDNGRIVEEGTHEELIKRGGVYSRLFEKFREGMM